MPKRAVRGTQEEFDRFIRRMDRRMQVAVRKLARTGNADEFADRFVAILEDGHVGALWRGRILAGDNRNITAADRLGLRDVLDEQADYFAGYLDDIEAGLFAGPDGKLSVAGLRNRSRYYLDRLRGTANEALVAYSPEGEDWAWDLGAAEHCDDCLDLAHASPLTEDELWTKPGMCETACRSKCKCRLRRISDGVTSFAFVNLYEQAEIIPFVPVRKPAESVKPAARAS